MNTATETSEPEPEPQPQPKPKPAPELKEAGPEMPHKYNYSATKASVPGEDEKRAAASAPQGEVRRTSPIKSGPKVGRNDPCPCGSGKKYKNCHGKNQ